MKERIAEAIKKAYPVKENKPRSVYFQVRVTPEEKEEILAYFGTSTNIRQFLLDAIDLLRDVKKKLDETGTLFDEEHSTEHQ